MTAYTLGQSLTKTHRTSYLDFMPTEQVAFLMASVCKEDRDVLQFLWVDDIDRIPPAPVEMRFTRVAFGVSANPFLLNATLYHHLEKYQKALLKSFRLMMSHMAQIQRRMLINYTHCLRRCLRKEVSTCGNLPLV